MAQADTPQPEPPPAAPAEEYGGPAILTRGETAAAQGAAPVAFRPYIGLNGIYDTGLVPVSVTATGGVPSTDLYGVELNLGAYTYRKWKHTTLGLDYRGDLRHYSQNTFYDGTDQFLSLIVTHRPSRRVAFTVRSQAGLYSRNYFLTSALGTFDPNYLDAPLNDIYDSRAIFAGVSGDLTYNKSARLSFNFGGEGNLVRRQSSALYGVTEATARADMQYRITRHTTLGVDYNFTHYTYTRGFGNTNIHSVGVNYSTQFTRHLQLSARIGGARLDSSSLAVVPLDPAVAALLGVAVAIQAAYRVNYAPDLQVRLTESFPRSSFSLAYMNNVTPGNGVYLTSRNNMGSVSYSYSGVRYWNFGVDGSYGRMTTVVQTLAPYTAYGGGLGVTRELTRSLHAVLRFDARHFDIASLAGQPAPQFNHMEYRATLGLTFSPGDVPLVLW